MNVFFSWSGDRSKDVAAIFNELLPQMIQAVNPFFSPNIPKGTAWFVEIAKHLDSISFGILFVTRDNLGSPWLMFEAGALFKHFGDAKVCPVLFDGLSPADLEGALPNLNVTDFAIPGDFMTLLRTINNNLLSPLKEDVLQKAFDRLYPDLSQRVNDVLSKDRPPVERKSPERELLEKILSEIQSGFAVDTARKVDRANDIVLVAEENVDLKRENKSLLETLALVEKWPLVHKRILDLAGLTDKVAAATPLQDEESAIVKVADVFRNARVMGVVNFRVRIMVSDPIGLEILSEEGLQIAGRAVASMFLPPRRAAHLILEKSEIIEGQSVYRNVYPDSLKQSPLGQGRSA